MAINRSQYYQAPAPTVSYKGTPAYEYASIFLKNRASQWELAQKQAADEVASGSARDKILYEAYSKRAQSLDDRLQALDKSIADAAGDQYKAINEANKAAQHESTVRSSDKAAWEAKKSELVNVGMPTKSETTSQSSSTGSPNAGGMAGGLPGADAKVDEIIGVQKSIAGDDPVALATAVSNNPEAAGFLSVTNPTLAARARWRTVNTSIDAATQNILNANPQADPVAARTLAEQDVLNQLDAGGQGAFSAAYEQIQASAPTAVGAGSGSQSTSHTLRTGGGQVQLPKYHDLGDMPNETVAPYVVAPALDLTTQRAALLEEIAKNKPPGMSDSDFITRSREIMAGRFGPAQATPSYYQRNIVQGLSGLDQATREKLFQDWKARNAGPKAENYSTKAMSTILPVAPAAASVSPAAAAAKAGAKALAPGIVESGIVDLAKRHEADLAPPVRIPPKAPSPLTYYKDRIDESTQLAGKKDKLARLTASGAGKVAADMYRANMAAGQPFQKTYEELTLAYAGDPDGMRTVHNVAIALDMASKDARTPKA